MRCQSPSSLFSHPLTAVMIRRDNAMTSRHASNLQRRGIGPRYARGEGIWGGSAGQQGWTPTNEAIRAYDGSAGTKKRALIITSPLPIYPLPQPTTLIFITL